MKRSGMVVLIDSLKLAYTIAKGGHRQTHKDTLVALSKDQFLLALSQLVFDGEYAIFIRRELYPYIDETEI